MGLVLFVLIGAFIGWLAAAIKEVDEGVLLRIGIGMLGAVMGAFGASFLGYGSPATHTSWIGVLFSVVGAATLLGVMNLTSSYKPHDTRRI